MTTPQFQVRRATVEDVPALVALWKDDNLPWTDLEKRFKEFQIVAGSDGTVLGALGLQIVNFEGILHSEVFTHPEEADLWRDKLWERIQTVAVNHGLCRIWTKLSTPFWHMNGFRTPTPELIDRLPEQIIGSSHDLLFIHLKDETAPVISIEKEFELFRESEKEQTQKLFRQARVLKMIAAVLGVVVFLLVLIWAFLFMRAQGRLPK